MGVRTDDIARARQSLIQESVYFALFWFAVFMLPFFVQIRRMVQPLVNLSKAAQEFAAGNLDYPTPKLVHGDDEISRLTTSFQGMAQALVLNRNTQAANLAELNNEKSTLDALLATMPVGVIFADRSHIRFCNAAFNRMFMLGPNEQLVGMKNDALLLRLGQYRQRGGCIPEDRCRYPRYAHADRAGLLHAEGRTHRAHDFQYRDCARKSTAISGASGCSMTRRKRRSSCSRPSSAANRIL